MTNHLVSRTKYPLSETKPLKAHNGANQIWFHILPILLLVTLEMVTRISNIKTFDYLRYSIYYVFDIVFFYIITFGYMPWIIKLLKSNKSLQELAAVVAIPVYSILLILYNAIVCRLLDDKWVLLVDFETLQRSSIRGILICALAYAVAYARYAIKAERESNKQKLHALRLENNLLSVQTNPHLINNVLNFVYERVRKYSPEDAKAIALLCEITSDALTETDELGKISLHQEVTYIERYLQLNDLYKEKEPFSNISMNISGYEDTMVPPKILLEPIVNLFKYGDMYNKDNPAQITLEVKDGMLHLNTRNAKRANPKVSSHRIGLKSLQQRLEINYPDQHFLYILDEENSFALTLNIKLC